MANELVLVSHDGPITTLTLNRPNKKNALSIALRDEMSNRLGELADRHDTRVVIITGSGEVFSAGFDLGEFADTSDEHQERLWASSDRFHHALLRFPLPVIAAVNGPALAGGFDLACLADIRIASDSARFAHPEQRWATVIYRLLHDLVGGGTARDLVLTGRSVSAEEAMQLGLVAEMTSTERLMQAAIDRATMIAQAPREALICTKAKIIETIGIPEDTQTLDF